MVEDKIKEEENLNQNDSATDEKNQSESVPTPEEQPEIEKNESLVTKSDNEIQPQEEPKKENRVIHKKDGRLHIYVRQDKYKGELKSKNWVGRLYIDGKQKISSSGTQNLEEAIPVLEKWFDDLHEAKAKEDQLSKTDQPQNINETNDTNQNQTKIETAEKTENVQSEQVTKSTEDKSVYCKIAIGTGSKTAIIDPTTGMKFSIKVNDPKINASSKPINQYINPATTPVIEEVINLVKIYFLT